MRTIEFIINGVPFVMPADFLEKESSSGAMTYAQGEVEEQGDLDTELGSTPKAIPMDIINNEVNITLKITTGSAFFINTYSLFKATLEGLFYMQTFEDFPSALKFCTFVGKNEYMEYGQLQSYHFEPSGLSNNTFTVSLSFQRKKIEKSKTNTTQNYVASNTVDIVSNT